MTFNESRLRLDFDRSWSIIPFDKTKLFKKLTGQGLRGVDFLGIRNEQLYLIEVKNYSPVSRQYPPLSPNAELFILSIREKFSDTQRLIRINHAAFRRHFLFRFWQWVISTIPYMVRLAPNWLSFWHRSFQLLERTPPECILILIDPGHILDIDRFPKEWTVVGKTGTSEHLPGLQVESEEVAQVSPN